METKFQIFQLNMRKGKETQLSVMNDEELKDYTVILMSEPWCTTIDEEVITIPQFHRSWTKFHPTTLDKERRWPLRSLLWINTEIEAIQVLILLVDLIIVVLRIPESLILVVSVYVECGGNEILEHYMELLRRAIQEARAEYGPQLEVVLAGDFNRHNGLWGGARIGVEREGEAEEIIDLMDDFSLQSLLKPGTITWQRGRFTSTIDLILVLERLAESMISCQIYTTQHGSDHYPIETTFDVARPEVIHQERLLLKNAPWKEIQTRVAELLD
jgi:hypothetical protein